MSRGDRHSREHAKSKGSLLRIVLPLAALAAVTAVGAVFLDAAAKRRAEEAKAARAARIGYEYAFLRGERERLRARQLFVEGLPAMFPAELPEEKTPAQPLDPEPRYAPDGRNILLLFVSRGRGSHSVPDDRGKLADLLARAEAEAPPASPQGPALETDLEHVLSRYVAVAEVLERVEAGDTSLEAKLAALRRKDYTALRSFEGGACILALRVVDSTTGEVVAAGGAAAESSEEIMVEVNLMPTSGGPSMADQIERAADADLRNRIALAVAGRLRELAGGTWDLGGKGGGPGGR